MKKIILIIVFTFFVVILFALLYPHLQPAFENMNSNHSKTEIISANEKVVDNEKMDPKYDKEIYFWKQPSQLDYKSAELDKNNKGLENVDSLIKVETRIEAFTAKKAKIVIDQIPAEIAKFSRTGADCNIPIVFAKVQVARIAKARNISFERIDSLIMEHTSKRLIGVLGPQKINVLFLNAELDKIK